MNIDIAGLHISTTTAIFAAVVTGIGVVLIILIWLCCYWCCRQKDRRKRSTLSIPTQYTPGAARGNQHGERARQRQQQHNPPRQAEHHVHPNHMPPPVASPLQQPHIHLPSQSSTGSTSSKSPTPQIPSAYPRSKKSNISGDESSIPPPSPAISRGSSQAMFTYNELAKATKGFSDANFLGEGGFGLVHKGVLPNGKEIAVKSLRANSGQGEREFEAEVEIISRVHHRHLVALVGYCITGFHRLLVYEFVTNKTLEFHLHGKGQPTLDWPTRMKVALGSAKGLAYLHEDCQPRIIHRDIKATNILLDNKFQAKVADFGLAKLTPEECTHVTTRVMGTLGYLAPEYASSGRLTEKSDVYSFGVMLLELITGRRPIDITKNNLVEWARPFLITAMKDENFNHLVDPRLQFSYKHSEMARMLACAASCVRKSARSRPLMSQVVRALEGNMSLDELNKGITPGHSMVQRYDSASDHSGSQYRRDSEGNDSNSEYSGSLYKGDSTGFDSKTVEPPTREFFTSEYGGTTSEYGLHRDSTGFDSKAVEPPTREFVTSEYGGTTSEYGLHASSSSDEDRTTNELDSVQVQGNRRHFQNRF